MNIPEKAIHTVADRRLQRSHDKRARAHSEERWEYWAEESEEYRETQIGYIWDEVKGDLEAAAGAMYAQALRDYADDLARVVPEGEAARLRRLCRIQHIRLRANELDPS